jgi:hypothetical protein
LLLVAKWHLGTNLDNLCVLVGAPCWRRLPQLYGRIGKSGSLFVGAGLLKIRLIGTSACHATTGSGHTCPGLDRETVSQSLQTMLLPGGLWSGERWLASRRRRWASFTSHLLPQSGARRRPCWTRYRQHWRGTGPHKARLGTLGAEVYASSAVQYPTQPRTGTQGSQ